MKEKKYHSPTQVLAPLFLIGFWSTWYLLQALNYGKDTLDIWLQVLIIIFAVGLMITSLVFSILTMKNKNFKKGDELTEKCMRKAGYYSFAVMLCLVAVFFVALQIVMLVAKDSHGNYAGGINDLLDVRIVLSVMALVQIIGTFLFAVLTFIFSKKVKADVI